MLLTEEEAKTKWCPFVPPVRGDNELINPLNRFGAPCIASQCMAWRWEEIIAHANDYTKKGFCGLAGKVLSNDLTLSLWPND